MFISLKKESSVVETNRDAIFTFHPYMRLTLPTEDYLTFILSGYTAS